MKWVGQMIVCLLWTTFAFQRMRQPPDPPEPFEQDTGFTGRSVYNPELGAAVDQSLRDYWQKPKQVLASLGDLDGMTVADIGCGEGYFTLPLLELVGPDGKVFATDIQESLLDDLAEKIPEALADRIQLILSSEDDTGIPEPVDIILVVQVFGEVPDQVGFLDQLKRIMHKDTRLVIIDSKHVTDPEHGFTRPLNLNKLLDFFEDQGLVPVSDFSADAYSFLPKQFFFVLARQG